MLGLTITARFAAADTAISAERDLLNLRANVVARTLAHDLQIAQALVRTLQDNRWVVLHESEGCRDFLKGLLMHSSDHLGDFYVVRLDGSVACAQSDVDPAINLSDHAFFAAAQRSTTAIVGHPRVSRITGRWIWPVALALRDPEGQPVAVVSVMVNLSRLVADVTADWERLDASQVLVRDVAGRITFAWPERDATGRASIDQAQAGPEGESDELRALAPLPGLDSEVVVRASRSRLLAPHYAALQRDLLVIGLVLLVATALAWLLARRLVLQPLQRLKDATEKMISGDVEVRCASDAGVREFRDLSTAFDTMAERLSRRMSELRASEGRVRRQLARMSLLDQTTRAVGESLDLEHVFDVTAATMVVRMPVDFAAVLIHDPTDQTLQIKSACKGGEVVLGAALRAGQFVSIDQNGLSTCLAGRLVYEPDTRAVDFPFPTLLASMGLHSLVLAPLQTHSKVFGLLAVARTEAESFTSVDCEFLRQLGDNVALAIIQARLHGALKMAYDDLKSSQQIVMHDERLRVLGQMSSGIAHDINNALSPVALYADALLENETSLSDKGRAALGQIQRSVDDVAETLARLRDFYRKREGAVEPTLIDANELCEQVLEICRARWHDIPLQRGIEIHIDRRYAVVKPRLPGMLSEVRDALVNLVLNAVDAMPEGGTLTMMTGSQHGPNGGETLFEVGDTGIGMDSQTRERCLEPFFTTKGERGTGLGLATVFGVIQRHGGQVRIDSQLGQGTRIQLAFPSGIEVQPSASEASPLHEQPPACRLLLIDDDPISLKSLADVLVADGHSVSAFDNGAEGVQAFAAAAGGDQPYDAVFSDLGMPRMDGRAVAAAIKRIAPHTPVLLLTGWGQRLLDDGDTPSGVDRVIQKPPRLARLRQALASVLAGRA